MALVVVASAASHSPSRCIVRRAFVVVVELVLGNNCTILSVAILVLALDNGFVHQGSCCCSKGVTDRHTSLVLNFDVLVWTCLATTSTNAVAGAERIFLVLHSSGADARRPPHFWRIPQTSAQNGDGTWKQWERFPTFDAVQVVPHGQSVHQYTHHRQGPDSLSAIDFDGCKL